LTFSGDGEEAGPWSGAFGSLWWSPGIEDEHKQKQPEPGAKLAGPEIHLAATVISINPGQVKAKMPPVGDIN
jgi:hypothetical protein